LGGFLLWIDIKDKLYIMTSQVTKTMEDKEISNKRFELQRKSFSFLVQMVVVIGVPAGLAAYYGKKIGMNQGTHPRTMILFMIAALIVSWAIILIRFFRFTKEFSELDKK